MREPVDATVPVHISCIDADTRRLVADLLP
jgi:hypothetical protein